MSNVDDRLSKNFTLKELTRSDVAVRKGLDNTPNKYERECLKNLVVNVLQPIRDKFGPVIVSSGFRSEAVNRAVGGSASSQHRHGQAADIECPGWDNLTVAKWIRDNLDFDQLILEFYTPGEPNSGWIHCSYKQKGNRKECLTATKIGGKTVYLKGLVE